MMTIVSRRPASSCIVLLVAVTLLGCGREKDMPDKAEMRDSMPVMKAMTNAAKADSMLDTMPGGEMARGDSTASMQWLKKKKM